MKKKINKVDIVLIIKQKILEVSTNLNKIDKAMTNEIIEQMTEFEENKRKKEVRKSPYIINQNEKKEEKEEDKKSDNNSSHNSNSEKSDEENDDNIVLSPEDELKILELSGITKKNSSKKEEEDLNMINSPSSKK